MSTKKNLKYCFLFLAASLTIASASSFRADESPFADRIITYLFENGRRLSPSYKQADCSTLMTRTLEHYFTLSVADRRQINISFKDEIDKKDLWQYLTHKSNCSLGKAGYNCQHEQMFLMPLNKQKYPQNESCLCPPDNGAYFSDQEKRLSGVVGLIESKGGQRLTVLKRHLKGILFNSGTLATGVIAG